MIVCHPAAGLSWQLNNSWYTLWHVVVVAAGAVAKVCGGGGGGKPALAAAGGKDASKFTEALELARKTLMDAL